MKCLLIISMIFCFSICNAQISKIKNRTFLMERYEYKSGDAIQGFSFVDDSLKKYGEMELFYPDSLSISGDTVLMLKKLLIFSMQQYKKQDSIIHRNGKLISAAIQWYNTVSPQHRSTKCIEYENYISELILSGYSFNNNFKKKPCN